MYVSPKAMRSSVVVDRDLCHSAVTFGCGRSFSAVDLNLECRSLIVNNSGVYNRSLFDVVVGLLYDGLVFHGRYARGRLW